MREKGDIMAFSNKEASDDVAVARLRALVKRELKQTHESLEDACRIWKARGTKTDLDRALTDYRKIEKTMTESASFLCKFLWKYRKV